MDLDEYQTSLGGVTRYQLLVIAAATWLVFGSGPMQSAAIYYSAVPVHRYDISFNRNIIPRSKGHVPISDTSAQTL